MFLDSIIMLINFSYVLKNFCIQIKYQTAPKIFESMQFHGVLTKELDASSPSYVGVLGELLLC